MTDEDNYHGFMKPLLDRAKKVLFPDDIDTSSHGGSDGGFGHLTSTENVATTASSSSRLNSGKGKKSKHSSRARRARLLAASKNSSSLATISSRSVAVVAGSRSIVRSDDNSLNLLKARDATRRSTDKENKVPNKNSFPLANKRGNFQKMDSLGAILANEPKAKRESNKVSATARRSTSFSTGSGVVNVHRRKSKSSFQCSLSACSDNQQVNDEEKGKRYQKSTHIKFESRHGRGKGMGDSKQRASNKQDTFREIHRSSANSLTNESKYCTEYSIHGNEVNHRKGRRRSRCNHPVSSLVQDQVAEVNVKGKSGLSSLMALPASTQKTQKTSSFNPKKATRKKRVMKKVVKGKHQIQVSEDNSNNTAEADIQSTDRVVASLTSHVESLNIGNDQTNCSTPLTIRHRASPGGLTSPPGSLHRFSTTSSSNIFLVYSPLADSKPKKRFDNKKTPDSMSAAVAAGPKLLASPLATKMSISPNPYGCQSNQFSQNIDQNKREACPEDSGIPGLTSYDCLSPRICFESKRTPDNLVAAVPTMPSEMKTSALATNMSFSPNPGDHGPDESNQNGGKSEREAFIQDNKPSDDTSHDYLSPRICFERKKTPDNIVSAGPTMPLETETSVLATNMSISPNPYGYGPHESNQDGDKSEREICTEDSGIPDVTSHDCLSSRICFERKKTPDNIVSAGLSMPSEMKTSALATNMSLSPNPRVPGPDESNQNGGDSERETCTEDSGIPDVTSHDYLSPRICFESKKTPDDIVSAGLSMPSEMKTSALATNISLSHNPGDHGPDESNQNKDENEREAFIQDNKPSDDTSHDYLSPHICFESKKTHDNIVSTGPAMPSETETSALATDMSMSSNPHGYGPDESCQNVDEYEREAFIQDNRPPDDTSHDCLSPRKKKFDNMVSAAATRPSETETSALATDMLISPNPYGHRPDDSKQNVGENERETSHGCTSPRILITASTFISSPNIGGEALSVARSNLFPSHIDEQEANAQRKSELEKHRPGSDVLRIAAESAAMEVELKIASPIARNNNKLSNALSLHAKKNKTKLSMEESAQAKKVVADVKGDAEATQPRRSSRQPQQTDRFTVARWKRKKKKKGNKNGSQVRKNTADNLAKPTADLVEEKAGPPPVSEKAIAQKDVPNVSQENSGTISINKGDSENASTTENVEDRQGSKDEPKTLRRVQQETNPTPVLDADATEPRRSSRQSKPTERLTVARWKKKKKKKGREVQFDNSANLDKSADHVVEEKANLAHPQEEASANNCMPDVLEENSESSAVDKTKAPENAFVAQNAEDSQWSSVELKTLRNAQKEINPTSALYWQEVATRVGRKSSSECQTKWQSMVSTPIVRRRTKKKDATLSSKNTHHHLAMLHATLSTIDEEDDIFDSSPYREADLGDNNGNCATKFSKFGNSSGLSPCVNQNTSPNSQREEVSAMKLRRKGYITYIENLRKDISRIEKKRHHQKTDNLSSICTHIYADSRNGESQLSGKLLPDGTVKINERRESFELEEDDIWGDEEEEDQEE